MLEPANISAVSPSISFNLLLPKRLDLVLPWKAVPVPKIAVDKDGEPIASENQVRASCECLDILAEPVASQSQLVCDQFHEAPGSLYGIARMKSPGS
jgi:hypothetical protein